MPTPPLTKEQLRLFLEEDLGEAGDVTSQALAHDGTFRGRVVAREPLVASGVAAARQVLEHGDATVTVDATDGARVDAGEPVLTVEGPAQGILEVERLALNLLQRLSGIATLTRKVVEAVHDVNPTCQVAATRKTTPGLRHLEKDAVEHGGGTRHREGLHDAFLVKDNHLAVVDGDAAEAVARCRALNPDLVVEVEADTLEVARAATEAGADWVLLDNLTVPEAEEAYGVLKGLRKDVNVEVSGGLTPTTAPTYAPHADRVSLGYLTHSATAVDLGLDAIQ